jgi:hypothetical protein
VRRASGELIGTMEPTRRTFPARNMATTEAALMTRGVSQLYVSLGDPNADGSVPVRLYFKPQCADDLARRRFHVLSAAHCRCRIGGCASARRAGESQDRRAGAGGVMRCESFAGRGNASR